MFKQDYLLRQINQMIAVLARVQQMRRTGDHEAALQAIDEEIQRLTGLDLHSLIALSGSELLATSPIDESTAATQTRRVVLATLLEEAGELYHLQDAEGDSYHAYLTALNLMLDAHESEGIADLPEEATTIEALAEALWAYVLPPRTHLRLFVYFEETGAFADAETLLAEMLEEEPDSPQVLDLGIDFYQHLLARSDEELQAGDLPRVEVEAELAALMERRQTLTA